MFCFFFGGGSVKPVNPRLHGKRLGTHYRHQLVEM